MPMSVVKAALNKFPCTLIQGYGQTEGTTMTFLSQEDHIDAVNGIHAERLSSCGREGHVTSVRIVDEEGVNVPRDGHSHGESGVKSHAKKVGYWGRPDLTAQTMRDGWMWTGDIATWDEDGYVFIVDRAKDMIISGGYNVYPKEIETIIDDVDGVKESAVIGAPHPDFGEAVVAVIVAEGGAQIDEARVQDAIKDDLARFKHPKRVFVVDELPRNTMGKVQKNVLRDTYNNTFS